MLKRRKIREKYLELKKKKKKLKAKRIKTSETSTVEENHVIGGDKWEELGVPSLVTKSLIEQGFTTPTEIQQRVIPLIIGGHGDVIGAAETVCISCHI